MRASLFLPVWLGFFVVFCFFGGKQTYDTRSFRELCVNDFSLISLGFVIRPEKQLRQFFKEELSKSNIVCTKMLQRKQMVAKLPNFVKKLSRGTFLKKNISANHISKCTKV